MKNDLLNSIFYEQRIGTLSGVVETMLLEEGLISSYDIVKLKQVLEKTFKSDIVVVFPDQREFNNSNFDYHAFTFLVVFKSFNFKKSTELDKILSLFGYHIANTKTIHETSETELTIEPKYPIIINSFLEKAGISSLYHITHRSNYNSIKKIGLAPRATETSFYHPEDRIYLLSCPKEIVINFVSILARNKNKPINEFLLFKTPYNPNLSYFLDDTGTSKKYNVYACFVLKNITPKELEIVPF